MTILNTIKSVFLGLECDGFNLTSYIAKETDGAGDKAIEQLVVHGAKAEDAVYGFAFAGNIQKVNMLLAECLDTDRTLYTSSAIKGYVRAGNLDAVHALPNYRDYMESYVLGLAQAGNKTLLESTLDKNIAFFTQAVEGYSECNKEENLRKLIKGTSYYPKAIFYAARSGNSTLVQKLLSDCAVTADFKVGSLNDREANSLKNQAKINAYSLLNQAAQGYAAGGHFKEAALMIDSGASVVFCCSALLDANGPYNPEPLYVLHSYVKNKESAARLLEHIKLVCDVAEKDTLAIDSAQITNITSLINKGTHDAQADEHVNASGSLLRFLAHALFNELGLEWKTVQNGCVY